MPPRSRRTHSTGSTTRFCSMVRAAQSRSTWNGHSQAKRCRDSNCRIRTHADTRHRTLYVPCLRRSALNLTRESGHICRSPENANRALWNVHSSCHDTIVLRRVLITRDLDAQFMQRRHGFSPSSILPLHLQTSLYLQAWVTYFLENPSRDTYAHLVALHPDLVAPTADLHNASTKSTASSSVKHRPRIGQLPTFQTVGLSIGALIQELVDLPHVVTNPAVLFAISHDAFAQQTWNLPSLNIREDCICSECASRLFVARFWAWVRQRMESGLVPGYDRSRLWCWYVYRASVSQIYTMLMDCF